MRAVAYPPIGHQRGPQRPTTDWAGILPPWHVPDAVRSDCRSSGSVSVVHTLISVVGANGLAPGANPHHGDQTMDQHTDDSSTCSIANDDAHLDISVTEDGDDIAWDDHLSPTLIDRMRGYRPRGTMWTAQHGGYATALIENTEVINNHQVTLVREALLEDQLHDDRILEDTLEEALLNDGLYLSLSYRLICDERGEHYRYVIRHGGYHVYSFDRFASALIAFHACADRPTADMRRICARARIYLKVHPLLEEHGYPVEEDLVRAAAAVARF